MIAVTYCTSLEEVCCDDVRQTQHTLPATAFAWVFIPGGERKAYCMSCLSDAVTREVLRHAVGSLLR